MKHYDSQSGRARCTAALGSVTVAMKARKSLASSGIQCDVIKVKGQQGSSAKGCIYGIEYPCELSGNVHRVLANISIKAL